MGKTVNKAFILGFVGKAPEIRSTPNGAVVANFSVATNDRQKDSSGNWVDNTTWHNMIAFNKTAEIVRDYVVKGSKLLVEGKIQNRSWEKDGQKHYKTEIVVNELTLLSG